MTTGLPPTGRTGGRRIGMRLWLGAAFAGVTLISALAVYVLVDDDSGATLQGFSADVAVGRANSIADQIQQGEQTPSVILNDANTDTFQVWAVNRNGKPFAIDAVPPADLRTVPQAGDAVAAAQNGRRYTAGLPGNRTIASTPVFGPEGTERGAVVAVAEPPPPLSQAFDDLRGDRLRALLIAIVVGILAGFLVSTLITRRIGRLARSAGQMAAGRFDVPLPAGGMNDEIGQLATSLDSMRRALRETFDMLATERDRLSAIFDSLQEAVIVVGEDGTVRFSNPAAETLVRSGQVATALIPSLRRAAKSGADELPTLTIEDSVYGVQARHVPAERAVMLVVRDRTGELAREQAEREFVSNAAHELRNPLAGISGAIEVLRGGAKDDPEARERFLARLAHDAERMTRLTQSLLMLARVEAAGERGAVEVVDVSLAAQEAAEAVALPEGVELSCEIEDDLVAEGDPVLLRQVLMGLLTNACANTPAPGSVTLRASRAEGGAVSIEVEDTGKGITPEELDRVFERFYRGSGALEGEGFGLGLSIAKRMVQVMGGEIGVRSDPGKGSTFWVRLRVPKPTPTPVA